MCAPEEAELVEWPSALPTEVIAATTRFGGGELSEIVVVQTLVMERLLVAQCDRRQ